MCAKTVPPFQHDPPSFHDKSPAASYKEAFELHPFRFPGNHGASMLIISRQENLSFPCGVSLFSKHDMPFMILDQWQKF